MLYLKIASIFLKKITYTYYSKLFKELKNAIKILVGQIVKQVMDQAVKMLSGSVTEELLGLPKF